MKLIVEMKIKLNIKEIIPNIVYKWKKINNKKKTTQIINWKNQFLKGINHKKSRIFINKNFKKQKEIPNYLIKLTLFFKNNKTNKITTN